MNARPLASCCSLLSVRMTSTAAVCSIVSQLLGRKTAREDVPSPRRTRCLIPFAPLRRPRGCGFHGRWWSSRCERGAIERSSATTLGWELKTSPASSRWPCRVGATWCHPRVVAPTFCYAQVTRGCLSFFASCPLSCPLSSSPQPYLSDDGTQLQAARLQPGRRTRSPRSASTRPHQQEPARSVPQSQARRACRPSRRHRPRRRREQHAASPLPPQAQVGPDLAHPDRTSPRLRPEQLHCAVVRPGSSPVAQLIQRSQAGRPRAARADEGARTRRPRLVGHQDAHSLQLEPGGLRRVGSSRVASQRAVREQGEGHLRPVRGLAGLAGAGARPGRGRRRRARRWTTFVWPEAKLPRDRRRRERWRGRRAQEGSR